MSLLKGLKSCMQSNSNLDESYDVFISYQYENTQQVLKLYDKLTTTYNLKVWLDLKSIKIGDDLNEKILIAIKNSKIIIVCMTKVYSKSKNCQKELIISDNLKKKVIILMFENNNIKDLGKIGYIMDKFIRINIFKDEDALNLWCGNLASALFLTLEAMLSINLTDKIDKENELYKKTKQNC